jgi:hypothetical protein
MKRLIDLSSEEARGHFLKGSNYFNGDFPEVHQLRANIGGCCRRNERRKFCSVQSHKTR